MNKPILIFARVRQTLIDTSLNFHPKYYRTVSLKNESALKKYTNMSQDDIWQDHSYIFEDSTFGLIDSCLTVNIPREFNGPKDPWVSTLKKN